MKALSFFTAIFSYDWDGTWDAAFFLFPTEFKGFGSGLFPIHLVIYPRLCSQTLGWLIVNLQYCYKFNLKEGSPL
jgi:hypothetical protein